ncbi:uncharacterized protein LOC141906439 isoform X2 [Tubulanus polymorphus]|uniref:uncharacterized protein LOC141906439 isoform X2 n=1 Tax=Tubulanus polymorphus TaxID=672921 RepID=UPI003DA3CE99
MTYNFSSLIGQMQARIDCDAFYSYRVKSADDDGNILYSRHVTAIKVEEGILDNVDRDVILIVCGVMAIVLFVILLTVVYGRRIGGICHGKLSPSKADVYVIGGGKGH